MVQRLLKLSAHHTIWLTKFHGDKRYYGNLLSRRELLTGAAPFESALPYMGCCTLSGFVNTGLVLAGLVPPRRCTY